MEDSKRRGEREAGTMKGGMEINIPINTKLLTNCITGDDCLWQDVDAYYQISCLWIKCV